MVVVMMEWKMFGTKGKFHSAKEKLLELVRGLGMESSDSSLPTSVSAVAPYATAYSRNNYSLKAESKKAEALMYQRMFDRPR
jgi:hypothetical protein